MTQSAPTWEVIPTVPAQELRNTTQNPAVFFTEYGGEFTDRTRVDRERRRPNRLCRPLLTAKRSPSLGNLTL